MEHRWLGRAVLILALILAVLLGVLLVRYQKAERQQAEAVQAMQERAAPLERELDQLKRDLQQAELTASKVNRKATFVIGFQLYEKEDAEFAQSLAESNGVKPVFVLDLNSKSVKELSNAVREINCEVILTAESFTSDVLTARPNYSDAKATDISAFLLSGLDDTPDKLADVIHAGFQCVIRHVDNAENEVLESGTVTLSYSRIRNKEVSLQKRMQDGINEAKSILFVFDLEALHNGQYSESDLKAAIKMIQEQCNNDQAQSATVTDAVKALRDADKAHAVTLAQWEAYSKEQQEKIDAIRAELDEIYSQWKDEG